MGSVIEFLENKTILVTGASGFLAKIFVEKILRKQPNIKKLYLLLRASDANSASQRLNSEVICKDLFRVIREKYGTSLHAFISDKVTPVAGDINVENLGVMEFDLLDEMRRQVDVVVSSAATTKFDERYDMAFATNTIGVQHVAKFVIECVNVKLLLHVSTAYVSGETPGIILERPFKMGETLNGKNNLNIEEEKKMIQERHMKLALEKATQETISSVMKDFGIQRAKLHGWPNTYVFTKVMGEMLILEELREDVSLVILRPTIITSTYKEPFPGWIEGVKTVDSFIAAHGRGRTSCFLGDPDKVFDFIPADMVINSMIVAMMTHMNQPYYSKRTIYHVGSSMSKRPITVSSVITCMCNYFAKNPLLNKQGKPIITTNNVTLFSSMSSFYRYVTFHYKIPLKGLEYANIIFCRTFNALYADAARKIKITLRLADLYKPYAFNNSIYDVTNLNKLRKMVRQSVKLGDEMDTFSFDPEDLDWEDYFMKIHIPGLVKYALK